MKHKIYTGLEVSPIIAAAKDKNFDKALQSNVSVIFLLGAKILSIKDITVKTFTKLFNKIKQVRTVFYLIVK